MAKFGSHAHPLRMGAVVNPEALRDDLRAQARHPLPWENGISAAIRY